MSGSLTSLARLILAQAEALEAACIAAGQPIPSVFEVRQSNPLEADATYQKSSQVLIAGASQLIAAVCPPQDSVVRETTGFFTTAALRFVVQKDIATVLHEYGPKGLDVQTLATKANVADPSKLARALRYLATRHIFQEVQPNVFANSRISASFVKTECRRTPAAAAVSHFGGEPAKSVLSLPQFLESTQDDCVPPFQSTFGKHMFDYMTDPSHQEFAQDLNATINGVFGARYPNSIYLNAIDALGLREGDLIVDVGGGSGSLVLSLIEKYPNLKYEIQELSPVLEKTTKPYLAEHLPDAIGSQNVSLRAHNFFDPQPVDSASVFMFRHVIHNWPAKDALRILQQLRASAVSNKTRLVLFEIVTPYCCKDTGKFAATTNDPTVPESLLPNLGIGKAGIQTTLDLYMMTQLNSQIRTVQEFEELGLASGWKLDKVVSGAVGTLIYSTM